MYNMYREDINVGKALLMQTDETKFLNNMYIYVTNL